MSNEMRPSKQSLLTFVIVGAGLVGVELMGELTIFAASLAKSYPRIDAAKFRYELIEAGPNVMPELERDLADYAVSVFRKRGVNVRTNCPVKQIEPAGCICPTTK